MYSALHTLVDRLREQRDVEGKGDPREEEAQHE
jgi:hypothetical protein